MAKLTEIELLFRKVERKVVKAIFDYEMIADGDRIMIGLSGGKDSLALIDLLGRRMRINHPRFEVVVAHIVMTNVPYQSDLEYLRSHTEQYGIPFIVHETSFDPETDTRKSPCFVCSWTRRKALFALAKEHQCNIIALGHHQDDIIQTLLMNMTFQGAFGTMPPKLSMARFDMTIIRPMCLVEEQDLIRIAAWREYKKQVKNCPYEETSSRPDMKLLIAQLEKLNPMVRQNIWGSMSNVQQEYLPNKKEKENKKE